MSRSTVVPPTPAPRFSQEVLNELRSSPSFDATSHLQNSWLQTLLAQDGSTKGLPLASYPNLYFLEHPELGVSAAISPGYVAQPAPMGISDFGLGATPYTYSTPNFLGQVTFNAPPNMTNPGSESVIDPGAPTLGYVGSVYEFGIQLNTIMTNISLPGTNVGTFWTQNVLNVNNTGIHWVDDVFNFSSPAGYIAPGTTILQGCGLTDLVPMLTVYGGVYQCVGGTLPISAANFPLTIALYNNVTVNALDQDVLTFGYHITGTGLSASGVSDTLIFNSPPGSYVTTHPPGFTVSGTTSTPLGLPQDAEMVLVGQIGGANAVFRSLNGSMNLEFFNSTTGAWQSVSSAYNFGTDTGETSTGVTGTWSGTTEYINQGPSFLYGLWNAVPHVAVASGSIHFAGSISPSYGFVFLSNLAPDIYGSNFTWVPTNSSGDFNTYLPPSVPPATQYWVQAFAPECAEYNGTPFSTSQSSYSISLTASKGTLNSPLYMMGNAQAAALALAVTGSSSPPYTFSNLVVNSNYTFNHLNVFGFPSFEIFTAENVSAGVVVNDVVQGMDSGKGNFYIYDAPTFPLAPPPFPWGLIFPGPALIPFSLLGYSGQIQVFDGSNTTILNQTLVGNDFQGYQGSAIFLWHDTGVVVKDTTVEAGTYGLSYPGTFVGDSVSTSVTNISVSGDSNGVVDVGSTGTTVTNVTGTEGAFGIYALSSAMGSYNWINVTDYAVGVYAGGVVLGYAYYAEPGLTSTSISNANDTLTGVGAVLLYSQTTTVSAVSAYYDGTGVEASYSNGTAITGLSSNLDSLGAWFLDDSNAASTVGTVSVNDDSLGVEAQSASGVSVSGTTVTNSSTGIVALSSSGISTSGTIASLGSVGVDAQGSTSVAASLTSASEESIAVEFFGTTQCSATDTNVTNLAIAVLAEVTTSTLVATVSATNSTLTPLYSPYAMSIFFGLPYAAVVSEENTAMMITGVKTTTFPAALFDVDSNGLSLTASNASDGNYGAVLNGTYNSQISGFDAYKDWQGVVVQGAVFDEELFVAMDNTVTGSAFVDDTSFGVVVGVDTETNVVWNNDFIGNNGATSTYSAAHIQALALETGNFFYFCVNYAVCTTGVGNYWADWHTYGPNGYLAPYLVTGGIYDLYPIGPQETFTVTFTETGLSSGTNWSVTFNGVTHNSTTSTITFSATMGTFSYTLNGVSGYQLQSGPTGSVTLTGAPATISVVYTSTQSLATNATVDTFFVIALLIALIALILGLMALMMHRRKKAEPTSAAPAAWTPPAGTAAGAGGTGSAPGTSGGGSNWSEGSGSGGGSSGNPPSGS